MRYIKGVPSYKQWCWGSRQPAPFFSFTTSTGYRHTSKTLAECPACGKLYKRTKDGLLPRHGYFVQ